MIVIFLLSFRRTKPSGRFGSSVSSNIKNASSQAGIATASPSSGGNSQASQNVNQKGRRDRKKTSLPFHQRKSTNMERSPTPPMTTLSTNLKSVNVNLESVKGNSDLATEIITQSKLPIGNSPMPQAQRTMIKPALANSILDQSYSSVPLQSISPNKSMAEKSRKFDYSKNYKSIQKSTRKHTDYVLPGTILPKRPSLIIDTLEARSASSDKTFLSLYSMSSMEGDFTVSEVGSPISLNSANLALDDSVHDGEVIITRMPNKG